MNTISSALKLLDDRWDSICDECLSVLGSELHYQAMIYHCLRLHPQLPVNQLGMNVKMWITDPVSDVFKQYDERKHEGYRGGFEPIPDIVLFGSDVCGDWRRRKRIETLRTMLVAIEVKASERDQGRLGFAEIKRDIEKLTAHVEEARHRGSDFHPVMMIVDTAPLDNERMTDKALDLSRNFARTSDVGFLYLSKDQRIKDLQYPFADEMAA